jgi:hypothetical protein
MDGDLTSRNMNNGEGSNKDSPRFRNLKVNHRDNLSFRNLKVNHRDNLRFSSRKDKSKDLRFNNHNTLSLRENLKEGR